MKLKELLKSCQTKINYIEVYEYQPISYGYSGYLEGGKVTDLSEEVLNREVKIWTVTCSNYYKSFDVLFNLMIEVE